jgi:hypothetical protein
MEFTDGLDHLDESRDRRLANLINLYDHSLIGDGGIYEKFGINHNNAHARMSFPEG